MSLQDTINSVLGQPRPKKDKQLSPEKWHQKHLAGKRRMLIRCVCDLYNCPSTITGKVLYVPLIGDPNEFDAQKSEDMLLEKCRKIYGEKVVVELKTFESVYDSNNND